MSALYVKNDVNVIKTHILNALPSTDGIFDEMKRDIAGAQGKYLRARLCLGFASLFGCEGDSVLDLATSIELIHLASLLQDDVLDNAEKRRRRPAFHKKWNKDISILYSDLMFSKAYSIILEINRKDIAERIVDAARNMCEGEILHIYRNGSGLTPGEYLEIVEKKTASLFRASCETGAMLGTDDSKYLVTADKFGLNLGIAYQLIDDCMDLEEFDLKNNTLTMPQLLKETSCEKTVSLALDYLNRSESSLLEIADISEHSDELFGILNWVKEQAARTPGIGGIS